MTLPDSAIDTCLPDDLPAELNILMGAHFLYWKTSEVMEAIGAQSPLSKNERSVLLMIGRPTRMGELAELMQVLPSTVTSIADDLETKGFVTRERCPDDRRAWRLSLTETGRALRQDIIGKVAHMFTEFSGLSAKEIETMSDQMLKIAYNIKTNGMPLGATQCP